MSNIGKLLALVVLASVLWLSAYASLASPGHNQLKGHPSAYLAMHSEDPVQWRLWNTTTVAEARRTDRLLFISIGYYACHWCHVMHQESYQNSAIATFLNANFVAIKVDRELEPALDQYLMNFVKETRGYAGWPLQVFLTPKGYPLVGTSYLPPAKFHALLEKLHERWVSEKGSLERTAQAAFHRLRKRQTETWSHPVKAAAVAEYRQRFVANALDRADILQGGFGDASKFPAVPQLRVLLAIYRLDPAPDLAEFLHLSLRQMGAQGLRDQLGGGFFRYVTDPDWRIPHFEKMLYDNALLATLYFDAAKTFADQEYEAIARNTLDFMLRELVDAHGAFISSLSAVDGRGIEGGYYLWDEPTLKKTLTPKELSVARAAWQLSGANSFEGGYLPLPGNPSADIASLLDMSPAKVVALRQSAFKKLLSARQRRYLPRDEKVIAGWNALALRALVEGARGKGGSHYRRAARRLRDYLVGNLWDGERLKRAQSSGSILGEGILEDYAYLADGLLAYSELTNSSFDRLLTQNLLTVAWQKFYTDEGWKSAQLTLLPEPPMAAVIADGATPSPSSVTLQATLKLARQLGAGILQDRACKVLHKYSPPAALDLYPYATHVGLLIEHFGHVALDYQPPVTGGKKATSSPSLTC